jgi:ectoine hydroxylase-related dioxygenase (phytanoyl-CoA dioxygenase family)
MDFTEESVERFASEIEANGFTVIENAIDPVFLDQLIDAVDRVELAAEASGYGATNGLKGYFDNVRVKNLLSRDESFRLAATYPVVLALVERMLGASALLNTAATLSLKPGSRQQALHCDDLHASLPRPHQPLVLNSIWALSDFTASNGTTRVAPGSHRWAEPPSPSIADAMTNPNPLECEQVEMKAGSLLVFDGSIWHGGSENRSNERRVGLSFNYCRGWMRPFENFFLSLPLELVRDFTPELRALCGYEPYMKYVGVIDGQSPVPVLEENGWIFPPAA